VTKIVDQNGKPLKDSTGKVIDTGDHCKQNAIKPGVAHTLTQMMVGVITGGTGRRAQIPGHDIAGKTGTTQGNKTAAFVGFTPDYSVSAMYFDPKGKIFVGGEGGGEPASMFHDTMAPILSGQPNKPFPPADPAVAAGNGQHQGYVPPANPTPNPSQPAGSTPPAGQPNPGGGGGGHGGPGGGTGGGGPNPPAPGQPVPPGDGRPGGGGGGRP
jgi:membrane peptidoglycan carboxypeptidase